ncbi:hypothetical protein JQ604_19045 [Bradyrhizobium jicamae]|uniref:hypothetical protein n=1 Tax=Bradyrhizobium jicamae TaxID=280332 RepID=UPI001BA756F3|nr:hypothetical protein [Bradyrhizobium jicamae]MBR0754286.1 hypothetical protein [Bradyrhizobium jicamae]
MVALVASGSHIDFLKFAKLTGGTISGQVTDYADFQFLRFDHNPNGVLLLTSTALRR